MSIDTTFSFDPWEHFRVSRAVTGETRSWKLLRGTLIVGLVLLLLPPLLLRYPIPERSFWVFALLAAYVFVGIPLVQLRAAFAHRTVHGPPHTFHGIELHEAGVRAYCDHTSSEFNWTAIHKARETTEFFLIYHTKNCACYLPERALHDKQIVHVRAILQQHLGDKATISTQHT